MITFLSGGTGTPKLIQGFRRILRDEDLAVIVNTADDIVISDLYVSPDVDTVLYLFSNLLDETKFWGIKDDTFNALEILQKFGFPSWFNLGDKDLAFNLFRTRMIQKGYTQEYIVKLLSEKLGVKSTIIPCTNSHIESRIITKEKGDIHFQEFWIKYRANVQINDVYIKDIESAQVPETVRKVIEESELIIIGPSNPITSIGPIIQVEEISNLLKKHKDKIIAISPIIGDKPISGPTGKLMEAKGLKTTPAGIGEIYKQICSYLIIHQTDSKMIEQIEKESGLKVLAENIIFKKPEEAEKLARRILEIGGGKY